MKLCVTTLRTFQLIVIFFMETLSMNLIHYQAHSTKVALNAFIHYNVMGVLACVSYHRVSIACVWSMPLASRRCCATRMLRSEAKASRNTCYRNQGLYSRYIDTVYDGWIAKFRRGWVGWWIMECTWAMLNLMLYLPAVLGHLCYMYCCKEWMTETNLPSQQRCKGQNKVSHALGSAQSHELAKSLSKQRCLSCDSKHGHAGIWGMRVH